MSVTISGTTGLSNVPAGSIAATNTQAAVNELDTEKAALAGSASQAFSVAAATAAAHAVRYDQLYAPGQGCLVSSGALTVTGGTPAKIPFGSASINVGSAFDTTNNWFKPTVAGWYQINGSAFAGHAVTVRVEMDIYKNGAVLLASLANGCNVNGGGTYQVSSIVYFNGTTDYVEIWMDHTNTGVGVAINTGGTLTQFTAAFCCS